MERTYRSKYSFPPHPYYTAFRATIKSDATRESWTNYLHSYMQYHKMKSYADMVGDEGTPANTKMLQTRLIEYINYKASTGVLPQTIRVILSALRHFYYINDIEGIKWDKIRSYLGEQVKSIDDKAYTHEQIGKALEFADYRMRVVILIQASTGMRIGAFADKKDGKRFMRWGDLTKIPEHNIYSFTVYPRTPAQYTTFCTPECARAIDDYMTYRQQQGEILTPDSPLIREQFSSVGVKLRQGQRKTDPTKPKPAALKTILAIMRDIFVKAGLRKINYGVMHKRKENMLSHGMRKFAKKNMRKAGVDPIIIEYLIGHRSGDLQMGVTKLMMTYDPAEKSELLSEYLKAVDNLTISNEARERRKAAMLEHENKVLHEEIEKKIERSLEEKLAAFKKEQFPGM